MSSTESAITNAHSLSWRAKEITQREIALYAHRTQGSQKATERARLVMPLGVPSSFQAYDPHPIVVKAARGASMWDVDNNEYVDYDMGFGALFSGHINPVVRRAVDEQLDNGTLFVTPCELNADVAELLGERYGLPMWRFTNSGTEATMDAIRVARGASMWDVDDNEYVDYDMGFGALFSGHINPVVRRAVDEQLDNGTLFVTPCELNADVAELLGERYGLPMWRFTNSGTEATMDAIRVARGATGREKIVKVEGGYHGHHDEVMISMKPSLDVAGPADAPISVPASAGISKKVLSDTIVIPYNDARALERVLKSGEVACFIVEPIMENIGICLPDDGYLQEVREITEHYGTLLIFDEVKTGITAGWGGATGVVGVTPDLVALAKSIGGGLPIGAFGGKQEYMDLITSGKVVHLGTYNGNPLCMAAAKAVLSQVCTPEVTAEVIARNGLLVNAVSEIIHDASLPAHTVQFGAKGCVTWAEKQIRNYRDYKASDFDLAFAQWIHGINRGVLLPPGLDEQWLISVMHTDADALHYADVFETFVQELTK